MPRFNFNELLLSSKADITKIQENFDIIEQNCRTATEIESMIGNAAPPKAHSSADTTYGIGTSAVYGHCKVIDSLDKSTFVNGESLSAHQGKILNDAITGLDGSLGGMAKRAYSIGTASPSGGNNGDVYDQYFN